MKLEKVIRTLRYNMQRLVGCSKEEIEQLEKAFGFTFPSTYRLFLSKM
jgi:hypothetical protein